MGESRAKETQKLGDRKENSKRKKKIEEERKKRRVLCAYAKAFDSGIFGRYPANKKKEGRRRKKQNKEIFEL